jgi:DNA-binding transcriptional LysR family regulator
MEYRHLNLVREVCRHGSFGKAAAALGMSQPALSKNIARLEDQFGVKLFSRGKGATQPTTFALHIASCSNEMLGAAERIAVEVRQMAINETSRVRIGTEPISRAGILPLLVPSIVRRFPKLQLEIVDRSTDEIVSSLEAREFDFGVTTTDSSMQSEDVIELRLLSSPVAWMARPGHALFQRPRLNMRMLQEYPVVLPNLASTFAKALASPQNGRSRGGSVIGPDFDLIKDIVGRTDAITHGPAFLFGPEVAQNRLARLPVGLKKPYVCSMLVTRGAMHSPVIDEITRIARDCGAALESSTVPARRRKVRTIKSGRTT